jgi:hypothetical protein
MAAVLQGRGNHDAFRVLRISLEQRPDLHQRFRVSEQLPAFLVVNNGKVAARVEREVFVQPLRDRLARWLR